MTLVAARSKLAVVPIVGTMAIDAITANRCRSLAFWRRLLVTGFTAGFDVLAVESVAGFLVVIEIPQRPGTGVVAVLAQRAKFLLVLVAFLVTGKASAGGILEARRLMATLASRQNVATGQCETGQSMVKRFDFPGSITVALVTSGSGLSFVFVVFLVAAKAVKRGLAHAGQVLVAGGALDRLQRVRIAQRKPGFIVTEASGGGFPVTLAVAIAAFFTQRPLVPVVFLVAAQASSGGFLEHGALVAFLALHFGVLAQ